MIGGLLSGIDEFLVPKSAPEGAPYDAETLRMARATLLANLGATLLSAGQGGQSYDQRAQTLGRLGQGVEAYNAVLTGDADRKAKQLGLQKGQQELTRGNLEIEAMRNQAAREAAWREYLRRQVEPSAVTNVAVQGAGGTAPTPSSPAGGSPPSATPAASSASVAAAAPSTTPAPAPAPAPAAASSPASSASGSLAQRLNLSPADLALIAAHPEGPKIIQQLETDRLKGQLPKPTWEPVPPGETPLRRQLGISPTQPAIVQRSPDGKPVDFKLLGEDPDKPPAGFSWSGEQGQRQLAPIPGGPATQVPAENAARVGVATAFLERAPQLEAAIKSGVFEGATNRALLLANKGEPAYYYRLFQDGQDALIRALTGAGMPDVEAVRYAQRYLPNSLSSREEVTGKFESLVYALRNVQDIVNRGRGGPPSAVGTPPTPPYGSRGGNAPAAPSAPGAVRRYNPETGRIE